jgi:hypothetical protein
MTTLSRKSWGLAKSHKAISSAFILLAFGWQAKQNHLLSLFPKKRIDHPHFAHQRGD